MVHSQLAQYVVLATETEKDYNSVLCYNFTIGLTISKKDLRQVKQIFKQTDI